jgi:CelD/BcsL family acetyltransferase involved in cellulose biosynthesis
VNDGTLAFHRELSMRMAKAGVFRLFFATVNGRRLAAHACFDVGGRREYFFSGRSPEAETLRAGKLMVFHTVVDAVEKGFATYDFGYGGDEYKADFTKTHRRVKSLFLARKGELLDLEGLFTKYEQMVLEEP